MAINPRSDETVEVANTYMRTLRFKGLYGEAGKDEKTGENFVEIHLEVKELRREIFDQLKESAELTFAQTEEIAIAVIKMNIMNQLMSRLDF